MSALPCSETAVWQDGVHAATCPLCLGTSTFRTAFTWGCSGKMRLFGAPCSAPEMRGCQGPRVFTSPTFAVAFLERPWASLWCCPEASKPHQVCGQNQTQPLQKAASLPLFTYIKKAAAVSVLHTRILRAGPVSESAKQHSLSL